MSEVSYEDLFRRITGAVGRVSCSVRIDDGRIVVEWYNFGNVYGCYRSAEGATLRDALEATLAEIQASAD
ncbi:MAG: hypothetical protein KGM44_05915 [bacterium]|nr:hypothetical protein [bacterium]